MRLPRHPLIWLIAVLAWMRTIWFLSSIPGDKNPELKLQIDKVAQHPQMHVGAAFDVVTWFTESANIARFDAATGYIPPSFRVAAEPALVAAWAKYPEMRVAWDQVLALPGTDATAGALFGPSAEVERLFFALTTDVVDKGVPADEALQRLTDDINALLAQYDAVIGSSG
jgi:hypothetical protein